LGRLYEQGRWTRVQACWVFNCNLQRQFHFFLD
jgi:hypothetical protein